MRKWLDDINWDRWGIGLSFLCTIHCLVTPFVILSLPILARYYVSHPFFHLLLALMIVPVGFLAFYSGFRHHASPWALILGVPGLLIVAGVPYLAHVLLWSINETALMISGSVLLISAHLINRKACRSCVHHGPHRHSSEVSSEIGSEIKAQIVTSSNNEISQ